MEWKRLVYYVYDYLEYVMAISYTLCMAIWYFSYNLVYFPPLWYFVLRKIWQP
jgi:hypothetical protein